MTSPPAIYGYKLLLYSPEYSHLNMPPPTQPHPPLEDYQQVCLNNILYLFGTFSLHEQLLMDRLYTMDYGLWTMDYGLWTMMDYDGLWTMDYGLWIMDYGLWLTDYRPWITDYELCTIEYGLDYILLTISYGLLTTGYYGKCITY